jgi:hypothetical protein
MIDLIYNELKQLGAVRTYDQFSIEWLGMEKSYMRTVRAKQRQPSAKAIARCVARLQQQGNKLIELDRLGYRNAGTRLNKLAEACLSDLLRMHEAR